MKSSYLDQRPLRVLSTIILPNIAKPRFPTSCQYQIRVVSYVRESTILKQENKQRKCRHIKIQLYTRDHKKASPSSSFWTK
ncbi:hypothetical protein BVRB_9g224790 [Beta vulgaris subsp. vulgaris]|uniref:Uncharacterized protein n=1 Tax=Beta vulgaris subsp. vulgaris TaxID=3555 RepID=A0A0J8E059_BETVV|nr:hypothetical protein BVRB_9g224790 [Beta vulgaris subsp. vulgaris]